MFASTVADMVQLFSDPQEANVNTVGAHLENILLILYTFLMGSSLLYLGGYHFYLVSKNLTTHEHLRGKYTNRLAVIEGRDRNPFDKGIFQNFRMMLFGISDPLRYFDLQ